MLADRYGVPISTTSAEAAAAFDGVLASYLRFGLDIGARLKQTLTLDPQLLMARVFRSYLFVIMGSAPLAKRAAAGIAELQLASAGAAPREQHHVAALAAFSAGRFDVACACWEGILALHRRDVLALKMAHYAYFYSGDLPGLLASIERCGPAWSSSDPAWGDVRSMHAFALEEHQRFDEAERLGREAAARNPDDAWAVHSVAHVLEMQGRSAEGGAWLDAALARRAQWNNFRYHLVWHRALLDLRERRFDAALARYDDELWDPASDEYLDLCNDISLLLRLELAGVDVGDRWQPLVEKTRTRLDEQLLAFVDAHFVVTAAIAGAEQASAIRTAIAARAAAPDSGTYAATAARVGLAVADAVIAHRQGRAQQVVDALRGRLDELDALGGSYAQRELFLALFQHAALVTQDVAALAEVGRAFARGRTAAP